MWGRNDIAGGSLRRALLVEVAEHAPHGPGCNKREESLGSAEFRHHAAHSKHKWPDEERVMHEREEGEDEHSGHGLRKEEEGRDDRAQSSCSRLSASG